MANIKISDLPPAITPLDNATTLLEVTVLEAAEEVSRRVNVTDLVAAISGLDATFLTLSNNANLPNERVLTEGTNVSFVDSGPNGTLTINVAGGGFGDVFKVGVPVDNQLPVWTGDGTIEGSTNFNVDGVSLQGALGNGPEMRNVAAGATTPSFLPRRGDTDTGIANGGDDRLSLVAGGVSGMRLIEASGGVLHRFDAQVTLTAFAGGGIGSATQLNQSYNVVTTVATTGDSVKLSEATRVGMLVYVKNDGANALDLFPSATDDLGQGVGVAISLPAGQSVAFIGTVDNNTWTPLLGSGVGGDVIKVGTPVDNQVAVWTGDGTLEGDPTFQYDKGTQTFTFGSGTTFFNGATGSYVWDNSLSLDGGSTIIPTLGIGQAGINNFGVTIQPAQMVFSGDVPISEFNVSGNINRWTFDNLPVRIQDSTASDWIEQDHDGVDYNFAAVNTTDVNFTGLSGRIKQGAETLAFLSEVTNPDPILLSDGSAAAPSYSFASDTDIGIFRSGADILGLSARATEVARVVGALGANQFVVQPSGIQNNLSAPDLAFGDGDTGLLETVDDTLALGVGGLQAWRYEPVAASGVVQTNSNNVGLTASVTQTQAGGLALVSSYNEVSTVATTGDALTAFDVFEGHRLYVINNGANDLQLFPAVGDDFGAGVDTAITIAAGEIGIFLGRGSVNWDTLFNGAPSGGGTTVVAGTVDGQVTIWDIGNNQYEPVASAFLLINPTAPPTSPLGRISGGAFSTTDVRKAFLHQNIGASVGTVWSTDENGGTPSGFYSRSAFNGSPLLHDWGFWDPGNQTGLTIFSMTADLEFIHEQSAFFEERAAALGSVAGRGQVWVRDDIPNVLVYTDDAGTDFVLNAIAPGGGLPLGTVTNASLKWDGASNWVEETQVRMPGGATGLQVFDGGGTDNVSIGHTGVNGLINTVGSAEVIFGLTSGPTTGWRFEQLIRVPDGLATAPTMTFFGGGVSDGFFRGALGIGVSVGGVEHLRVSNATTLVASDDLRLVPNFGADSVIMRVDPPADPDDFTITLTSLVDFHIIGAGLERFVLEEPNLAMVEKAAAPGDVAGVGQFWVRNDVPNIPMFTDDAGTDKKLGLVNDAVQARRTTNLTLTTAFVDVTLDATDVETDAAVIEHDAITDRITIGETGTYEISYQFNIQTVTAANSLIDVDGRVRLNDLGTGIPGSLATGNCKRQHGNDIASHMSVTFIVDLTAADFVTLQVQKTDLAATEAFFVNEVSLQVTRLL